ncbi:Lipase 4 [Madurella mycetomatis]|uniref:Lipase 4 n=1 Tax=Madurella mycetomatis TaxID=100816 RepID=A0A175WGM5_9PEZI|nr:Lipase 4 [Madurella mycetomatis]
MMWVIVGAIWRLTVYMAGFWRRKLADWWNRRSPVEIWLSALHNAKSFDDWEEAALRLDNLLGLDLWRSNPTSRHYDYRLINERLQSIQGAHANGDVYALVNWLRSGLVRNLGNITAPHLYNRSFAGTKFLIEEYITRVVEAIESIAALPSPPRTGTSTPGGPARDDDDAEASASYAGGWGISWRSSENAPNPMVNATMTTQTKLDFVHDTRQAFGRSALVFQGGAIFGLCHLGVAKALFLRGLLPRMIVGTGTGALMASLIATHAEEDLGKVLTGDGIDLSAFAKTGDESAQQKQQVVPSMGARWATLMRRVRRFRDEGYFLDVKVLEECIRANIGDVTFEEAYHRSKRVLSITVVTAGQAGIPTVLNYITAPNVLVWTAATASNASTSTLYGHRETKIMCKDSNGDIVPWKRAAAVNFKHWTHVSYKDQESPLLRVAELFNVNHFIVSQARPYLIPFLQSDMHGPTLVETRSKISATTGLFVRMAGLEVRHQLRQLDTLGFLPLSIRRFLVDERVPCASMTLVPNVSVADFSRLLETPTKETVEYWILKGERSVWPAMSALKVRCAIEMELDRAYQDVRRLKAGGIRRKTSEIALRGVPVEGSPSK